MLKTTRFVVENMTDGSTFDNPAPRNGYSLESDRLNVCVKEPQYLLMLSRLMQPDRWASCMMGSHFSRIHATLLRLVFIIITAL